MIDHTLYINLMHLTRHSRKIENILEYSIYTSKYRVFQYISHKNIFIYICIYWSAQKKNIRKNGKNDSRQTIRGSYGKTCLCHQKDARLSWLLTINGFTLPYRKVIVYHPSRHYTIAKCHQTCRMGAMSHQTHYTVPKYHQTCNTWVPSLIRHYIVTNYYQTTRMGAMFHQTIL